jgi:hypothetical protein
MTVNVSKPAINVREKLAELDKPTGIAGEAMLRAETPQEQFNLIGAGRRNLIINGAMQIAQRGTSHTVTDAYTLDRFKFKENTGGAAVVSQSTDAPSGFTHSLKISPSTADTSLGNAEHTVLWHFVEGNDFAAAGFGSSDARPVTLSFWVKANKLGTYSVALGNSANNKMIVMEYTVNVEDTWEKKVITIPPATDGSWVTNTGIGAKITFGLGSGSTYTTTTIGRYITSNDFVSSDCVNFMDSTSNEIYFTGVQLELGKVATPFEHRSYGEELALCQRYYHQTGYRQYQRHGSGFAFSTTGASIVVNLPTTMRSIPALITSGASTLGLNYSSDTLNGLSSISVNTNGSSERLVTLTPIVAAGLTTGQAVLLINNNNSNAYIAFDAEL